MWTKYKILEKYYTTPAKHYIIFFECDIDDAHHMFSTQSRVFETYMWCSSGVEFPSIDNVELYYDSFGRITYIRSKKEIDEYLLKNPRNG